MSSSRKSRGMLGQAGIYLALSISLFMLVAAIFAAWSAKLSSLSAESREEFSLSLVGRRLANSLDIVERNNVGIELEVSENITLSNGVKVCGKGCVILDSLPPGHFRITEHPHGLRIEK